MSSKKIKAIVFLTLRPVSEFEEKNWCFSYLRNQGFAVEVLDLTMLLNKRQDQRNSVIDSVLLPLQGNFIHRISTYEEFEYFVQKLSPISLFIDYLVGLSVITLKYERVFRLLKKHNAKYAVLSSGALPLTSPSAIDLTGVLKKFQTKVKKALSGPFVLLNFMASTVITCLSKHRKIYPLPSIIFGGDSEVLQQFVDSRKFDKRIVPINSSDYDSIISFRRNGDDSLADQNTCVFLDEAATHHSDFKILGIEPAVSEQYFQKMNTFFDFIEKETGLEVVIAAHPRSNYESMPNAFSGRSIIKGKTLELVARTKLVVVHMSTSISYAVVFKKPIVSVKIPGLPDGSWSNSMVEAMSCAIGKRVLDLNKDTLDSSWLNEKFDHNKYSEYEKRYVKTEGAEEFSGWEIVVKTVNNMSL